MGNYNRKKELKKKEKQKEELKENNYINYYCKTCKEIPLLHFSNYDFDLICSSHKILNIPINAFFNHIILNYDCCMCKIASNISKNYCYCYECDKIYCEKCVINHNQDKNDFNNLINVLQKNSICLLHNRIYSKYCLNCKLNLCELCDSLNHTNHYIELFKDICPLKEDIDKFNKIVSELLNKDKENKKDILDKSEQESINTRILNKFMEIKILLVQSYNKCISNYNYINNLNNIIRTTSIKDIYSRNENNIQYINKIDSGKDKNNITNKIPIKSLSRDNTGDYNSTVWCIIQLNIIQIKPQQKLELIAIGGSNNKILLLNIITFKIYQIIEEHTQTIYSLAQFKDNPNYLFSSSEDESINIYKLDSKYKYKLIQKIKKADDKSGGEINKVIILTNKLLVTGDHRSITIWKSNTENKNEINYEEFKEIIINRDTCHLLEVNPSIFVATQYEGMGHFQVYKNAGEHFPLIGEINVESHGSSSNGLYKINDKLICSGAEYCFFIVCIEPLQVIQKFPINYTDVYYIYITKEEYLYCRGKNSIVQYRLIKDEDNNFIELFEIDKYPINEINFNREKAILPFDDGRIFFTENKKGRKLYQLFA